MPTNYSTKERLIASLLSRTPALKKFAKRGYIGLNSILHKKPYRVMLHDSSCRLEYINPIGNEKETFFGYYDKSPENINGLVIFNGTSVPTSKSPTSNLPIYVYVADTNTKGVIRTMGGSFSYNWQQGCRAQWLADNKIIFNVFEEGSYKSIAYDFAVGKVTDTYNHPIQDSYNQEYFLSINYARIMNLRPDYGYRNLPLLSDEEMSDLKNDGIRKIDIRTNQDKLIVTLWELTQISPQASFAGAMHKVNHVMISPDGKRFIFIHRWYKSKVRHDRLMISDFSNLRILADEDMVSHMCWVDNDRLFGYLRHNGVNGFYFVDVNSGVVTSCEQLQALGNGDGHPSCHENLIVVDTYPDKSLMQHLYVYNMANGNVKHLLEVYHPFKYHDESRCDLHPRFSKNGKRIYFDTVCNGTRRLAYVDISALKF
jgi:hypothetical protein